MDVQHVNPFVTATVFTFQTMMNEEITAGAPALKQPPYPPHDVSGVIGLSGDAQGSIAMSFPLETAFKVVSKILGMEVKEVGPDLTDGIGEVANIVAGNAKQHMEGCNLSISLPNVVVGGNHFLASPSGSPTIIVPFTSQLGDFTVEVSLKTK